MGVGGAFLQIVLKGFSPESEGIPRISQESLYMPVVPSGMLEDLSRAKEIYTREDTTDYPVAGRIRVYRAKV